jgi:signal transduction histidine kinase
LQPKQKEVLLESEQNCARLNRIVNSLLDLSRMESGKFELVYQENDFNENLHMVMVNLEKNFKRKNLRISLFLDPEIPRFKYDRERIKQVLNNLLENSLKFTPAHGEIEISAQPYFWERRTRKGRKPRGHKKRRKPSNAALTSSPPFNSLLVEIKDTGIGISREHQKEIFEEFTQVPTQQMNRSGMGLGLSIAKHIIDAHRGKIWVESETNAGSRFVFLLPLNPMEEV